MFPFDIDEGEEILTEEEEEVEYKEYEIDFETGQLTGRIVTGIEAIRVWAYLALHTAKYRYEQYSWDYGCEIEDLIGKAYTEEHAESEIQRMLEECLLLNEHITEVELLDFENEDDKLNATIKVITDYGEEEMNVDV